jgi:hypothetical protein
MLLRQMEGMCPLLCTCTSSAISPIGSEDASMMERVMLAWVPDWGSGRRVEEVAMRECCEWKERESSANVCC